MTPRAAVRLVYGLLTALLVGVYAGLVFLFGRLRDHVDLDTLAAELSASLWLRPAGRTQRVRVG